VRKWLRQVANARVHGTTGRIPAELLIVEQAALQSLQHSLAAYEQLVEVR
jgi:hypothetical protein